MFVWSEGSWFSDVGKTALYALVLRPGPLHSGMRSSMVNVFCESGRPAVEVSAGVPG